MKKHVIVLLFIIIVSLIYCNIFAQNLKAVSAGVAVYPPGLGWDVYFCDDDAEAVKDYLINHQKWNSSYINLKLNSGATKNDILNAIDAMPTSSSYNNLFFYSGHGDEDGLKPYDWSGNARIDGDDLEDAFSNNGAKYAAFLNACKSGIFTSMSEGFISTSCSNTQLSYGADEGLGFYTLAMVNGLKNNSADSNSDGVITALELHTYIGENIETYDESQTPQYKNNSSIGTSFTFRFPKPTGLSSSLSGKDVQLSWNSVSGASGYKVYMGTSSGSYSQSYSSATTSYTVTDLSYNTTYYFAVTAYNDASESYYSSEVSETTPVMIATISGPSTRSSNQSGTWTANVGGGTSPFSYQWYQYFPPLEGQEVVVGEWIILHGETSQTLTCADIRDFKLKVRVIDTIPDSVYSPEFYVTIHLDKRSITSATNLVPKKFDISQNYPNPFNPSTDIKFQLPEASKVTLKVYDMLGREVAELINGNRNAGYHSVTFNAVNLPSGVYIYKIRAGKFTDVKKMILMK
ncbi:T9SS type A sorting domain-containing protein [candidate division KSB1 bacterium]